LNLHRMSRGDDMPLTHLQELEAEGIHIAREVVAEAEKPEGSCAASTPISSMAKLMVDAGLIVLVSFISFVGAPLAVAEGRDPKELYRRARLAELKEFTGIGSPYGRPEHPAIRTASRC
jgi:adenylylsulfate kinase-like enzyme